MENVAFHKVSTPVGNKSPSVGAVFRAAHEQSDTDLTADAMHHTLGYGPTQAAPGKDVKDLIDNLQNQIDSVISDLADISLVAAVSGTTFISFDEPMANALYKVQGTSNSSSFYVCTATGKTTLGFNLNILAVDGVARTATISVAWEVRP